VPTVTWSACKGAGDEREFIGPLLSADGCARTHTRTDDMRCQVQPPQVTVSGLSGCVFITAGPITKLCTWGRKIVEDMCYEIRRAEACVD
jgi:hypothetical protein